MTKTVWETDTNEDRFLSCGNCAYKFLMELYEASLILDKPILGENYSNPGKGVYVSEDFFNEHAITVCGVEHTCIGCNERIGE
jgi:hypothetical protein